MWKTGDFMVAWHALSDMCIIGGDCSRINHPYPCDCRKGQVARPLINARTEGRKWQWIVVSPAKINQRNYGQWLLFFRLLKKQHNNYFKSVKTSSYTINLLVFSFPFYFNSFRLSAQIFFLLKVAIRDKSF